MIYLLAALLLIGGLYLVYHLVAIGSLLQQQALPEDPAEWPLISILVAARNEAQNIAACLDSLLLLDYPAGRLEILVGDDRSEDATAAIISGYASQYGHIRLVPIPNNYPGQRGKQNVLAHLAHHATGEFFLVTDADISVQPSWAKSLVREFVRPEIALVSGPTVVDAPGLFPRLQGLDWRYGVGSFQAFANRGLPVTAVGNNMAYRASAYWALGGYEAIQFSITEDYRLFDSLRQAGYKFRWPYHPTVINRSKPIKGLSTFLNQRKRWYKGGMEAPLYARIIYYLQALAAPAVLLAAIGWGWQGLLAASLFKLCADGALAVVAARKAGIATTWLYLPIWELYFLASLVLLPLYFILPTGVVWKGRRY